MAASWRVCRFVLVVMTLWALGGIWAGRGRGPYKRGRRRRVRGGCFIRGVVRHGPAGTPARLTTNGGGLPMKVARKTGGSGTRPYAGGMGRRLGHGCRRVWFDTVLPKTSARLTTNGCSPTAGLGQAPSTKSGQALPLAQGWLSTDRVRGPFAARGSWVSWLPFETLPLGTHKGHPYRGRADYKRGVGGEVLGCERKRPV